MVTERLKRQNDRLLDEAEDAVINLNWSLVRDRALAVLAFDPNNADAKEFLSAAQRAITGTPSTESAEPQGQIPEVSTPVPGSDEITSFSGGRYKVKHFLGEVGRKKVYLVTDSLLDRDVSFTLINTDGLDQTSINRIKREALAMARLGSHSNVVTVFHIGDHEGQPFIVTELMEGGNLQGLMEQASNHQLQVNQAVEIALEICRALDFAHTGGIVHRDLNPGNVWLTNDGVSKVADFGLDISSDSLGGRTAGTVMAGAVSYMSPEKAAGGEVTTQSDLYSLGAILYQMITGRPPFSGEDSRTIIGRITSTPPEAPSWHNPDCPLTLENLILRLLAKDPFERPASVADVISALHALDPEYETADGGHPADAYALDRLFHRVFVGRQREMGELKAALEDALAGRGQFFALVGERGIGKTRTAQELAAYAEQRGARVLWGRCYAEQGLPSYWPWEQAIRYYVRERDVEGLRSEMGAGAADIAQVVSDVKERLPDLNPLPPIDNPAQARTRLFESIISFLKNASQRQPLVLVLEDLHWANQPSLQLLQFASRELTANRLLIVGTYRDFGISRQNPLSETLADLNRGQLLHQLLLQGLREHEVAQMIELVTGVTPSQSLTRAIFTQTEGNPFYVMEVLRLIAQEGGLSKNQSGVGDWTVRMSEGVEKVIGRRLDRLSRRCYETLITAAFIGREFTLEQLTPLMDELAEERLVEVLEEALAARLIEELPQEVGIYHFSHSLIHEVLIRDLPDSGCVLLHARIAKALEQLYGADTEAHAAELAYHFAQAETGEVSERLGHYSLLAGERALAVHAWEDALGHFQRALVSKEGQPTDAETAAILFGLARSMCATVEKFKVDEIVAHLVRVFRYFEESGVISNRALSDLYSQST